MHQMIADPLTKPIACDAYERHMKSLGLRRFDIFFLYFSKPVHVNSHFLS